MIFLLVNDDGINSKRLWFARDVLKKYGEVFVVAPEQEQSGKSMAITTGGTKYREVTNNVFAIDGTPVDCVIFALSGLNIQPDYVISGINKGYNLGMDTKYSGTVGAALQACQYGKKAIAFSGDYKGTKKIEKYFEKTLVYLIESNMPSKAYVLNVNFPKEIVVKEGEIKKAKLCFYNMKLTGKMEENRFISSRSTVRQKAISICDRDVIIDGDIAISKICL